MEAAAAVVLEDEQELSAAPPREARQIEPLPVGAQWVGAHEGADHLHVPGMKLQQRGRGQTPRVHGFLLKRDLAGVPDENVAGRDIAPAARRRTQAEIVLFSIAAAERTAVEGSDVVHAIPPDIEAESDAGRYVAGLSGKRAGDEAVELGKIGLEVEIVVRERYRVAEQRGVVRP